MGVDLGPRLRQGCGDWVGTLPGLGTVTVDTGGRVAVAVEQAGTSNADTLEQRERALRLGWGEPLSFARRGFGLVGGVAVSPAGTDSAMLLVGDPDHCAIVVADLAGRGWELVSDRPCPVGRSGPDLVVHPRAAPLLMPQSSARRAGLAATPVRGDTDAVWVDVPRASGPRRVAGLVSLRSFQVDQPAVSTLRGHAKLEFVSGLFIGGVLGQAVTPKPGLADEAARSAGAVFADRVHLSALPALLFRLHADPPVDTGALRGWWEVEVHR